MEPAGIHPSRDDWWQFLRNAERGTAPELAAHLQECEFCRGLVEALREQVELLQAAGAPEDADLAAAERLYRQVHAGLVVPLAALELPGRPTPTLMAADRRPESDRPAVENLATVCSEDPPVVLMVMRDHRAGEDYLQLVSDNPALRAHVLVELPDIGRSYLTDETGRARLGDLPGGTDLSSLHWLIKLPQAEFDLAPLSADTPDRPIGETVLTTERGDRIRVSLAQARGGRELTVEILSLQGRPPEAGPVTVAVSLDDRVATRTTQPRRPVVLGLAEIPSSVHISLFC